VVFQEESRWEVLQCLTTSTSTTGSTSYVSTKERSLLAVRIILWLAREVGITSTGTSSSSTRAEYTPDLYVLYSGSTKLIVTNI
jgi:hypothetical protein